MIVYVDVLLGINFMVNFVLLRLTAQFSGEMCAGWRSALSALFGAFSALVVFFPDLPAAGLVLLRLAVSLGMVVIAFGAHRETLPKLTALLFLTSFLLSGVLLALSLLLRQDVMSVYRGVVYFDIGLPALLGSVVVAYLLSRLLSALLQSRMPEGAQCRVTIVTDRGSCTVPALLDTGSSLTEPFSGNPVLVCDGEAVKTVLPAGFGANGETPAPGNRLVPYRTLSGKGLLEAFRPSCVLIETKRGVYRCEAAYVAVSQTPVGNGQARAVLNPALLRESARERGAMI